MRKYSFFLLVMLMFANMAYAQSWLQSGAMGGSDSRFNQGASTAIQSVYQNINNGSLGFWIGEDLDNGAFIQAGYEIVNQSALYPTDCRPAGCSGSVYIEAGVPTWFWEYFPAGYTGSNFYGGIGTNASAGANGTFNTYSFKYTGSAWNFYFNNEQIGSADLGTSSSGQNMPSAIAEIASAVDNRFVMKVVQFKDVAFYNGYNFVQLPNAYSSIGYGVGSDKTLQNVYGVKEVDHNVNYFEVGSGLPLQSGELLWQPGYSIDIVSQYGNITGSGNYSAYTPVTLRAPRIINLSSSIREVFVGWKGAGIGAYTGNQSTTTVITDDNIEETTLWQRQYYLNVNGTYNSISGAGWYNASSTATLRVTNSIVNISDGTRLVFEGWNGGPSANSIMVLMNAPINMTVNWGRQYFVNVTTQYGYGTGIGWYNQNSTANLSITESFVKMSNESRIAFVEWSNGASNKSVQVLVNGPITLNAQFARQYLVHLVAEDAYGAAIGNVTYYNISSKISNDSVFLFSNKKYNIEYIYYKNTTITTDYSFEANSSGTISVNVPVYNVAISARSMFGTPINATVDAKFKNGTDSVLYTGTNGTLVLHDVPYGYVTGYVKYIGLGQSINLSRGSNAYLTFVTPSLMIAILVGIVIIVLVSRITIHYRDRL